MLPSIRCFYLFWWFRLYQPSRFGRFVGIRDFGWVVSLASLVSVVAFCCFGCHPMIFDVISPCLKPLRRSTQQVDSTRLPALKQVPNVHTFSVSYRLLFLAICLALSLSLVFFLSVACINKFPSFLTLSALVRVNFNVPLIASG